MSANYSIEQDLKEAVKMVEGLSDYLLQDELYGNIRGGFLDGNMPKLTVGALLMRLRRLQALRDQLNSKQSAELDKALEDFEHLRKEWTLHYEQKILHEFNSRLNAMQGYFREVSDSPSMAVNIYKPELSRRTIVQELVREMEAQNIHSDDLNKKINETDSKLRGTLLKSDFQWSDTLKDVYPQQEFWWLYGKPSTNMNK